MRTATVANANLRVAAEIRRSPRLFALKPAPTLRDVTIRGSLGESMRKSSFWAVAVLVALPAFAQRLPENVVPKHYRVMLAPDLASEKFSGNETIEVELREPSATITLNSAEIDFDDVSITSHGVATKAKVSLDAAKEQATLTVAAAISG